MKVAYISGRYSGKTIYEVVQNVRVAEAAAIRWWNHGFAVICPHLNTALMDGALEYEQVMRGDLELVSRCDVIVMLPNWRKSAGAAREHELAQELGKEIVYE